MWNMGLHLTRDYNSPNPEFKQTDMLHTTQQNGTMVSGSSYLINIYIPESPKNLKKAHYQLR